MFSRSISRLLAPCWEATISFSFRWIASYSFILAVRWSRKIRTKVKMVSGSMMAFCQSCVVGNRGRDRNHAKMAPSTRIMAGVLPSQRESAWTAHSNVGGEDFGSSGCIRLFRL